MWGEDGLQVYGICSHLDQTIRNLISGDLGILLVVMQLGVTGLKMTRLVCLLDLSVERDEEGWLDLVCVKHL